ncbi:hypothetical protein A2866_00185 [Candidatus Roizmanbacteria bacterium RIFCSPHIGHO2_01_FULL_39_8]|uniref:Uncharacterized protein n=2 Tax=Candidatus Roizmaniibacteriota TaxID=1752723 RepID=A0A1F7GQK5_9BACT|nr:MAG: hypothetical protein A2866_00185 [Candidatus Roizmanbacteria bacterium RIFCSPHIGHO2_01_FULL_39_8]OGK25466.1 MAG: hypothetical protein A3C28_04010 [Candidatus Roizmanbacteria bacterium RIFCSPHIGHO2_02_FULL_39_9]
MEEPTSPEMNIPNQAVKSPEVANPVQTPDISLSGEPNPKVGEPANAEELAEVLKQLTQLKQFQAEKQNGTGRVQKLSVPHRMSNSLERPGILTRFTEWIRSFFNSLFAKKTYGRTTS